MIVEILLGLSGIIWIIEANESEIIAIIINTNINIFDFTVRFEEID
jgi:hypothetical protein